MSGIWPYVAALIPSAGVGFLFWLVIKNMIEGDRKERLAHSQWDAAQASTRRPKRQFRDILRPTRKSPERPLCAFGDAPEQPILCWHPAFIRPERKSHGPARQHRAR